jgi:hypothetical protein
MQADGQSQPIIRGIVRVRRKRVQSETPVARERRLAAARAYTKANRERIAEYKRGWAQENSDRVTEYQRGYYARNGEVIRDRSSQWRVANLDQKREANRQWALLNPDKAAESGRRSKRKRRSSGQIRLFESVSEQIRQALVGAKDGKRWEGLVGYTRLRLVYHIERQFADGMTWANYGRWHIDHILPASSFAYESPDDAEFKACWALSNLRPLWAADNISKRDTRHHLL